MTSHVPLLISIRGPDLRPRSMPESNDLDGFREESGVPWIPVLLGLAVFFRNNFSEETAHGPTEH